MDWFKIGKGVHQGCILSPYLFNLYAEYIMQNAGLDEAQAGIKISRRNINNIQICRWHHPYGRKGRRSIEPLDEGKTAECKSWLKTQHSKNEDHGIWSHNTNGDKYMGIKSKHWQSLFSWVSISLLTVTAAMKLKITCFLEEKAETSLCWQMST